MKKKVYIEVTEYNCPDTNVNKYKVTDRDEGKVYTETLDTIQEVKRWIKSIISNSKRKYNKDKNDDNVAISINYRNGSSVSIKYKDDTFNEQERYGKDKRIAVSINVKHKNTIRTHSPEKPAVRIINPKYWDSYKHQKHFRGCTYSNARLVTIEKSSKEIRESEIEKVIRDIRRAKKHNDKDVLPKLFTRLTLLERKT